MKEHRYWAQTHTHKRRRTQTQNRSQMVVGGCREYWPRRATGKANRLARLIPNAPTLNGSSKDRNYNFSATEFVATMFPSIAPVSIWINEANLRCRISDNIQSHWINVFINLDIRFHTKRTNARSNIIIVLRTHFPFTVCAAYPRPVHAPTLAQ